MLQKLILIAVGALAVGCSAPDKKLTQIQQDKEQLLVAIRDQREKNRALQNQVASLETRLDQAEKELARTGTGTRISTRPSSPLPPTEPLPWRSPPKGNSTEKPGAPPSAGNLKTSGPALRSASGSIQTLAARDKRIHYEGGSGQARVVASVAFEAKTGNLTAESKRELDQVSKLLRSEEARDLQVTISAVGGREHAQAVADYLDSHGIEQQRLRVVDPPAVAPAALRPTTSDEVRITLSEAEQPMRR